VIDTTPGLFLWVKAEMHRGYVKLWRKLQSDPMWLSEKFTRGQAWVDLVGLANHSGGFFRVRGNKVEVKRGQLGYSELSLADRWKWSRGKVRRFLAELESEMEQKIVQQKTFLTTLITILNYEIYQGDGTTHSTADGQQTVQQTDSRRYTNKNDKNDKNDKNEILCPQKAIVDLWEEMLPELPKPKDWGPERQALLRARWTESEKRQSLDWWKRFFEYIRESSFLMGDIDPAPDRKRFFASLPWVLKKANFLKIIEGNYDHD